MYVENGMIQKVFSEANMRDNAEDDPFLVSDAATMLSYLQTK